MNYYLTNETITFNINGNDLIYSESTADPLRSADFKNVLLNEDFAINMGSYLDKSVDQYYCEVVQYIFNSHCDGKDGLNSNDTNFTQLFTDLYESSQDVNYIERNKARSVLTQFASTKNNFHVNDEFHGITRQTVAIKQKISFVCNNFNQKTKYFRMLSMRDDDSGFIDVSTDGYGVANSIRSYSNAELTTPYSKNIDISKTMWTNRDNLKSYPHVILYMTPIYKDRIPRLFKKYESTSIMISTAEANWRENNFGAHCKIPIPSLNLNNDQRYKAVFRSLILQCNLSISQTERSLCNYSMHLVAYNWDKSRYGYLGCKNESNCSILTTMPYTFNYQDKLDTSSKLEVNTGSILEIDSYSKTIEFKLLTSQMIKPTTDNLGAASTINGFLNKTNPVCEWVLLFDIYPI